MPGPVQKTRQSAHISAYSYSIRNKTSLCRRRIVLHLLYHFLQEIFSTFQDDSLRETSDKTRQRPKTISSTRSRTFNVSEKNSGPPQHRKIVRPSPNENRPKPPKSAFIHILFRMERTEVFPWRREWDLNPRGPKAHRISAPF